MSTAPSLMNQPTISAAPIAERKEVGWFSRLHCSWEPLFVDVRHLNEACRPGLGLVSDKLITLN